MMGLRGDRPMMMDVEGKGKIVPIEKYGIQCMSIGFLIEEKQAVIWRGPMASSAIKQFITDVHWGELDYLIIDLPPGTGDVHLTMVSSLPVSGAVIVTTPQLVAAADAKKGVMMFKQENINIPVLGIIENMAYFTPAELPNNKYYIFGKGGGKAMAEQFEVPFLGEIPLVQSVREGGDMGIPVEAFKNLAGEVARQLAIKSIHKMKQESAVGS
jgi:ATP-binding protein involved in chromosome partitioning